MNELMEIGMVAGWISRMLHRSMVGLKNSEVFIDIAVVAASVLFFPVLVQSALYLIGISLTSLSFLLGLFVGICVPLFVCKRNGNLTAAYLAVAVASVISLVAFSQTWDNSYDSLDYHEPAIRQLAAGADPAFRDLTVFWSDHYPKASWIYSAGVFALTGSIETARVVNVLALLCCMGVCAWATLLFGTVATTWRIAVALLLTFNPVTLYQLSSHYVDGQMSSLGITLIVLFLAVTVYPERSASRERLSLAIMCSILMINLKYTGLVFVVGAFVLLIVWTLLGRRRDILSTRGFMLFAAVLLCGTLVVGFSPYLTNLMDHHDPVYPMFSSDLGSIGDAPDQQRPDPYLSVSAPAAFGMSLLEKTSRSMDAPFRVKNPLIVTRDEGAALLIDPRRGGFGPLFFLALIAAGVSLGINSLVFRKHPRGLCPSQIAGICLVVLCLTLLMVESWWARLAPFFFFIPVFIGYRGLCSWSRIGRAFAAFTLIVLILDCSMIGYVQLQDYRNQYVARKATLQALSDRVPVRAAIYPSDGVTYGTEDSLESRILEAGYDFEVFDNAETSPLETSDGRSVADVSIGGEFLGRWEYYPMLMMCVEFE